MMRRMKLLLGILLGGLAAGCGGGTSSGTTGGTTPSPVPPHATTTLVENQVTISHRGVQPKTTSRSTTVTFKNTDTAPHQILFSNCPDLSVGLLQPGESMQVSLRAQAVIDQGQCNYYDALNPSNVVWQGILVAPDSGGGR